MKEGREFEAPVARGAKEFARGFIFPVSGGVVVKTNRASVLSKLRRQPDFVIIRVRRA